MEILVNKPLEYKLSDDINVLKDNCKKWEKNSSSEMHLLVDVKPGCEPCPFCYSGGDKMAKMAMIGINPGAPVKNCQYIDENTTWQELAEFCAPSKGILNANNSVYHMLSKNAVESKFYKDLFLIHQALVGDRREVYDKFTDAVKAYGGRKEIEKSFIEQLAKYPVLNSDFIPYKSNKADCISIQKMIDDIYYRNYLHGLINLLLEFSSKDAYVVFYGHVYDVKKLLSKIAGDYFPENIWVGQMLGDKANSGEKENAYFARWNDERVVVLIPSRAYYQFYRMGELINKIREFSSRK